MHVKSERHTALSDYSPAHLLNEISRLLSVRNDSQLANRLDVTCTRLSRVRNGHTPLTAALLIRMHEVTELDIATLLRLLGDRRGRFRISRSTHPGTAADRFATRARASRMGNLAL